MLKYYRMKKGLSQQEVATLLGVAQSTVAMWENGTNTPRVKRLLQLAELYGCTMEELLREDPNETEDGSDGGEETGGD